MGTEQALFKATLDTEIRRCPKCGGEASLYYNEFKIYWIACHRCNYWAQGEEPKSPLKVVDYWNRQYVQIVKEQRDKVIKILRKSAKSPSGSGGFSEIKKVLSGNGGPNTWRDCYIKLAIMLEDCDEFKEDITPLELTEENLNKPLDEIGIPDFIADILEGSNIITLSDLLGKTREEIQAIDGIGAMKFASIVGCLRRNGLALQNSEVLIG